MRARRAVRSRAIPGVDEDADREVRISCPDATGLGCDIARLLLDFGLRIMDGAPAARSSTACESAAVYGLVPNHPCGALAWSPDMPAETLLLVIML